MSEALTVYYSDVCVICLRGFSGETGSQVSVHQKGLSTLIACCQSLGNQQLEEYLLSGPGPVNLSLQKIHVHAACRLGFIKKRSAGEGQTSGDVRKKKLRSTECNFNWKTCCFICEKPLVMDERHPLSAEYHSASTLELRSSILYVCCKIMDQWALEVESRLYMCNDLVAAEAVYHQTCCRNFRVAGKQPEHG